MPYTEFIGGFMEKLNIAKILKDCPKGMELDCVMYDNVTFEGIKDVGYINILIKTPNGIMELSKNGCYHFHPNAKCIIFPKGKTTWKGFHRPFKDGDIIYVCDEYSDATFTYVAILKQIEKGEKIQSHCFYNFEDDYFSTHDFLYDGHNTRFATEEEKEKLFKAIKDNGYKWNPETKTLEKLIKPKFKVGDRITNGKYSFTITHIVADCYHSTQNGVVNVLSIEKQDEWKLEKFDITTLKAFDKVLVRYNSLENWHIQFFEKYNTALGAKYPFICLCNSKYCQCIPYEGNEHLRGTTNDCDEYYKTWE